MTDQVFIETALEILTPLQNSFPIKLSKTDAVVSVEAEGFSICLSRDSYVDVDVYIAKGDISVRLSDFISQTGLCDDSLEIIEKNQRYESESLKTYLLAVFKCCEMILSYKQRDASSFNDAFLKAAANEQKHRQAALAEEISGRILKAFKCRNYGVVLHEADRAGKMHCRDMLSKTARLAIESAEKNNA